MQLPLVDEVREARRLAEEASQAAKDLQLVHVQLSAVAILERQADLLPDSEPLPADDLVQELMEKWAALADLGSIQPSAQADFTRQLNARRTQLELARQVLRPLALAANEHAEALHRLQHEQRHALEDPAYAEAVSELVELGERRGTLALELPPYQQQISILVPARDLCAKQVTDLAEAIDEAECSDTPDMALWIAHVRGQAMLDSIRQLLTTVKLAPPSFDSAMRPDESLSLEERRTALAALHAYIERLHATIDAELARVQQDHDVLRQEYEEIEARLKERMG